MRRLRQDFQSGETTDAPLTDSATTINSAEFADLLAVASGDEYLVVVLDPAGDDGDPEIVHVTAHTASATSVTVTRGEEGTTAREHAAGTIWKLGPTARDFSGPAARADRTSGNLTLNSTTWANVDTGLDLTVAAAAGDWIEVGLSRQANNEAISLCLDVVSLVSGSPVSSWGEDGAPSDTLLGVLAWFAVASVASFQGGSIIRQVDSADISAGSVTLRLRYRTLTSGNKSIVATAANHLTVWAKNHGA